MIQEFHVNMNLQISKACYLKNPESSDLGKKIVVGSIDLIYKMGFETFTFGKLAREIKSTEASIYRYFESKHKLLLYLTSWYWAWMEYRVLFGLANINSPMDRLVKAVKILTEKVVEDSNFNHINEVKLHKIVIAEASKAYLTKEVDKENKNGLFTEYKQLVGRLGNIVTELNQQYKYPKMLISTIIEGAHLQQFFAAHLPNLTDCYENEHSITNFYTDILLKTIATNDQ